MRIVLFSLLLAAPASGAGFFVQDVGHLGIARQGALAASGDDLTALWYNPANLSAGRGLRLQIDVNGNFKSLDWQRAPDPAVPQSPFAIAHNQFAFVPVPTIAVAYDFTVPGLAVALGVYAPNNSDTRFAGDGPQRYSVVTSGSFVLFYHLGVSYQPLPWLRFGAGLFATSVFFDQRMAVNLGLSAPESPDNDIYVSVYGTQHFLMNANFGVWVKPGAGFEIGGSFLPGRRANARGQLKVEPPKALATALQVNGNSADFQVDFPWIARGGVAWRFEDVAVIEANLVYEGWSSLKAISISPRNISLSVPPIIDNFQVGDIVLDRAWKDTYSVRIGGEALVFRPLGLRVRAGYGYEPGAVPDDHLTVSANDVLKHNIGLGIGLQIDRFKLGVAYGHSFYLDKTITNSQMRLTNPLNPAAATVVGNGTYRASHEIISVSLSTGFL